MYHLLVVVASWDPKDWFVECIIMLLAQSTWLICIVLRNMSCSQFHGCSGLKERM
jgi:hypothetical protein